MKRFCAAVIRGVMRFFALFPLGFHYFWVKPIAWILEKLVRYRVDVVYMNLSRAFPEKKIWELRTIAHDYYIHMAEIIVESIWFSGSTPEKLRKTHIVEMENVGIVDQALKDSPSVTVLTSHRGNWEIIGGITYYNFDDSAINPFTEDKTYVVYKRLKNEVWDMVFKQNRMAPLIDYRGQLESKNVLRFCIKNRAQKALYCFIADQYPYQTPHLLEGQFMNQRTLVMAGSVAVAHKLGHSVVYMDIRRESRGHYTFVYKKICDDASKMEVDDILRQYFTLLEEDIKAQPANWLWSHNRWKY